ncbi:MAG: flagellar basal body-associated FliL family protein [Planctomycetota bacterium]
MNLKKIALLGGVGLASAAAGVAIPQMMSGGAAHEAAEPAKTEAGHDDKSGHGSEKAGHDKKEAKPAAKTDSHGKTNSHGASGHGKPEGGGAIHSDGPSFVPFGRIVTNLNEQTLTKYLSLEITLQTDAAHEVELNEAIETRKPILSTWLTSHLADKTLEDIRGKVGVNRLRREIQDNFNSLLFTDGHERVLDVLFEEFHVQ